MMILPIPVLCRFCQKPIENDKDWPVCKTCYEDGTYLNWLQKEIHSEIGDTPRVKELQDTIRTCYGARHVVHLRKRK